MMLVRQPAGYRYAAPSDVVHACTCGHLDTLGDALTRAKPEVQRLPPAPPESGEPEACAAVDCVCGNTYYLPAFAWHNTPDERLSDYLIAVPAMLEAQRRLLARKDEPR